MCEQAELKALQERLDIDKQHWEENYKKKEVGHCHMHCIFRTLQACLSFRSFTKGDACQQEVVLAFCAIMCGKVRGWQVSSSLEGGEWWDLSENLWVEMLISGPGRNQFPSKNITSSK